MVVLKKIFFFVLVLFGNTAVGQKASDPVDLKKPDFVLVEQLFQQHLNDLRKEKGLHELKTDLILARAARDQSLYQQKINSVTHDQRIPGKETPAKRVKSYKGMHSAVGENCLLTWVGKPVRKKDGTTIVITTYAELAADFFNGWKNSPGHYKNMISPLYEYSGLSFAADPYSGKVYAAQVFGSRPYVAPHPRIANTEDSWKVESADAVNCTGYGEYDFVAGIFSQYLWVQGDSVYQYYRELEGAKKIISSPRDGVAIDIVFREQFGCDRQHNLHPSEVHDGIMLKPVYAEALFRNNLSGSTGELFSFIGVLPEEVKNKNFQLNTILIRNGRSCRYSFPVEVVSENHSLLNLRPVWMNFVGEIQPGSYKRRFYFDLPFAANRMELEGRSLSRLLDKLGMYAPFITEVNIEAFSSVDGKEQVNLLLQEKRAEKIREVVKPYLRDTAALNVVAKENWELFYQQIQDSFPQFSGLAKTEVKRKLENPAERSKFRSCLDAQRIARVEFSVEVNYSEATPVKHLPVAMHGIIADGDSLQARIVHSKMVYGLLKGELNADQFTEIPIPAERKFVPVLINYLGALSMAEDFSENAQLENMRMAYELGKGHPKMEFNYLVYNLKYWATFQNPLLPIEPTEKKIESLRFEMGDSLTNSLLLNFYVLSAYHSYINKEFNYLGHSLEGIHRLYKLAPIYESDAIKLALLFNEYYRFSWTMDVLRPFIDPDRCSLEALFLYARTGSLYRKALTDEEYYALMRKCSERDQERFCNWIDQTDFQLLRDEGVQEIWCSTCKQN